METAWRPKTMSCPHCGHRAEIVCDAVSDSSNIAAMGTYRCKNTQAQINAGLVLSTR